MADPRPLTRTELGEFLPNQRAIRAFEKLFELIPADLLTLLRAAESASNEANSALTVANKTLGELDRADLRRKNFFFVSRIKDLPRAIAGIVTLRDNATYFFTTEVDLEGLRLVGGRNTAVIGSSPENCRIKSTGLTLGNPLISSQYSLALNNISLEAATIFDLDASATPNQALDWYGVNFRNSGDIGRIANYSNFVGSVIGVLSSAGLTFDGAFGTIAWESTIFSSPASGSTAIVRIPASCTITRRFRIIYSSIVVTGFNTGIDVSTSASIPVERYILDTCSFAGSGTYTAGVSFDDNKARWTNNTGVRNSAVISGYYMINNATVTNISATSTPVKAAGTTTPVAISQRFDTTVSNRAEYIGAVTREFKIAVTTSLSSNNNNQIQISVAKNGVVIPESVSVVTTNAGGRAENAALHVLTSLVDTDFVEVWVENITAANNITVIDLSVIVEGLN